LLQQLQQSARKSLADDLASLRAEVRQAVVVAAKGAASSPVEVATSSSVAATRDGDDGDGDGDAALEGPVHDELTVPLSARRISSLKSKASDRDASENG